MNPKLGSMNMLQTTVVSFENSEWSQIFKLKKFLLNEVNLYMVCKLLRGSCKKYAG